jgi:hypothetical protein
MGGLSAYLNIGILELQHSTPSHFTNRNSDYSASYPMNLTTNGKDLTLTILGVQTSAVNGRRSGFVYLLIG